MKGQLRLLNGKKLKSPDNLTTRPTTSLVREALMNILSQEIANSTWLDLFSGSGVIGCEVLQKGASSVVAIESNKKTYRICQENLKSIASAMGKESTVQSINCEVRKWLKLGHKKQKERYDQLIPQNGFDFVYLDPPYKMNIYTSVLNDLLAGNWIKNNTLVICECSINLKITPKNEWIINDQRFYGKTSLMFISPNQALHSLSDTDSTH